MIVVPGTEYVFQEVEGSPRESGDANSLSATRIFRGPAEGRFAFIRWVMGYHIIDDGSVVYFPHLHYPDNPSMLPVSWSIENSGVPMTLPAAWSTANTGELVDDDQLSEVSDLQRVLVSDCRTGLECEVTINYSTPENQAAGSSGVNGTSNSPLPVPEGTSLTVSETYGLEEHTPRIDIQIGAAPAQEQEGPAEHINVASIRWEWKNVIRPNFFLIKNKAGKLNGTEFFGYPKWSVQFSGVDISSKPNNAGVWVYDLTFSFTAKLIAARGYAGETAGLVSGGKIGFWGRAYTPKPIAGTNFRYPLAGGTINLDLVDNDFYSMLNYA